MTAALSGAGISIGRLHTSRRGHTTIAAAAREIGFKTPLETLARINQSLNGVRHKTALRLLALVVLFHLAEHSAQAVQIFVLNWPRPEARGVLGMFWPWLVNSEALHYGYALLMLAGLIMLRPAFTGEARTWWNIALAIQVWHHFEHLLLLGQVVVGQTAFGAQVPPSVLQTISPRVELHLANNYEGGNH